MFLPYSFRINYIAIAVLANGVGQHQRDDHYYMETLGWDKETALQQLQSVKVARYLTGGCVLNVNGWSPRYTTSREN